MEVVRPTDPDAFLDLVVPALGADPISEARHNLLLGIASTLRSSSRPYPEFRLWVAVEGHRAVCAALMTPPFNLVLSDPDPPGALDALLDAVRSDGVRVPGVVGNEPSVHVFADGWTQATGSPAEVVLRQGVFALTDLVEVPRASGTPRLARDGDRALLHDWAAAFAREALPPEHGDEEHLRGNVDARLEAPDGGFWLWEDGGRVVSLTGFGGRTPTGIRIGPVYTPPELRGRGYGTSLVEHASRVLLEGGLRACFLYTDLSNPTSNAIYERIGYRRVCTAVEYRFVSAASGGHPQALGGGER